MEQHLRLEFGSDGFATIQMINGENRLRTSTIKEWHNTLDNVLELEFGSDGFATIQMINGENRFRTSTIKEWHNTLDKVLENNDVKGLLLTGTGKFFSNGIDLTWLSQQTPADADVYLASMSALYNRILVFPVPTVAMINGHAFGGGAFISLACDFRLMKPDRGWLCWPEMTLGLRFGDSLLELLRAKIPPGYVQREALLYAKRLTGPVAKSFGLVDVVLEESKMAETGKALVLASLGPKGLGREIVQRMKRDLYCNIVKTSKL